MKHLHTFESFTDSNNEIEVILSKEEDMHRVLRAVRTDRDLGLSLTHTSKGYPLGNIRGMLMSLFFANEKDVIAEFIQKNGIKVANAGAFDLDEEKKHPYFKGVSKSTADKKKAQMDKQASMDSDDPDAYKKMPGDTVGKKSTKTSKHTKSYHEKFGKKEQ